MFKRLLLAAGIIAGLLTPGYGAGTITLSGSQRFDNATYRPLNGGKLYFYQAGTTTPQSAYQDSGLTIPHPNPIVLDSGGNVPSFYLADGSIKIRLENAQGVTQLAQDGLLVIGASSGGGGGSPVDPTTIIATGDLKVRYGTGALSGFVRANGRTIGSAVSSGTERANADTQALFQYLWDADPNLLVTSGRGASAAADWAANKTITLPDWRGRLIGGLDDMGNSAASRITLQYLGVAGTTLGAAGGFQAITLGLSQLPAHTHTGVTDVNNTLHNHSFVGPANRNANAGDGGLLSSGYWRNSNTETTATESSRHTHNFTTDSTGSGSPFSPLPPLMLTTVYLKL